MSGFRVFDRHARRYDDWFTGNKYAHESEILALRTLMPDGGKKLEVGAGTGRFAIPPGIHVGLEPSREMATIARARGINMVLGVGEKLPFADSVFDTVLMVTTICFLDNAPETLAETARVLGPRGSLVLGFVDRDSELGWHYLEHRDESPFYREAEFYSVPGVLAMMEEAGFSDFRMSQTLFRMPRELEEPEPVMEGYGRGAFVVVRGEVG